MSKPRVYIAAPLFNEAERKFNEILANALRASVDVYLPQSDGILLEDAISRGEDPSQASKGVFAADIGALRKCDALLIVLNGRTIDEGAAFELGVAWSLGKRCIGYKNDPRQLLAAGDNPMIVQAVSDILCSLKDVEKWGHSLRKDYG